MNRNKMTLLLMGLLAFGGAALADDSPSDRAVKSHGELLADCVTEMRASNPSATEKNLRKQCILILKTFMP